jgi:hypothetical protein
MKLLPSPVEIESVAIAFAKGIAECLEDPAKLQEIDSLNASEPDPNICHSHDFCDANVFMLEAVNGFLGLEEDDYSSENEEQNELFNAAWAVAKDKGFSNLSEA